MTVVVFIIYFQQYIGGWIMGSDTVAIKERLAWIGKMVQPLIIVLFLSLGGWIFSIGGEIAVLKEKTKESEAQWNALFETQQQLNEVQIELKAYKLLFSMLLKQNKISVEKTSEVQSIEIPKEIKPSYKSNLDTFKRQHIQQALPQFK